MSIPLTASTEKFTPACMAEIEGAPAFTFRHATVLDKHRYHNLVIEHGIVHHSKQGIRDAVIEALRTEFDSEGMERNITRIEAYWQANDELELALREHLDQIIAIHADLPDGADEPELPPRPVIDFPEHEIEPIEALIGEVRAHSHRVRKMQAENHWHTIMMPRLLMAMFLTSTTLPVKLKKADGILTMETTEAVIEALAQSARDAGVSADEAVRQLQDQAMLSYTLKGDEEKNSSSPRSDTTSPASSLKKSSSGKTDSEASSSSDPATSEEVHSSTSSD